MKTTSLQPPADLRTDLLAVDGRHGALLQPTRLHAGAGQCLLVTGEPGHGHTAFALALAGRLTPTGGSVRLDGRSDATAQQRAVALVDTPGVTEPDDVLPLSVVVGEGLAMAGRPAGRADVRAFLDDRDAAQLASTRVDQLPSALRTRVLADLAAARPGVRALVLTLPDRHGGHPEQWWQLACSLAEGPPELTVLVTCTPSSAHVLGVDAAELGGLS